MKLVAAAIAALVVAVPVHAAPVTDTYTVTASNFAAGAPYGTVSGTFSVSFDNAASVGPTSTGLTVTDFTLSGYSLQYVYSKSRDWLTVGTNLLSTGGCSVAPNANQFCAIISNASTTFTPYNQVSYAVNGNATAYNSTFTVTRTAAAVPEPAIWATMILGLGGIGVAMRRRRAASSVPRTA